MNRILFVLGVLGISQMASAVPCQSPTTYSCTSEQTDGTTERCRDYFVEPSGQNPCGKLLFSEDACPATDRVYSCSVVFAKSEFTMHFYSPAYTAGTAAHDCRVLKGAECTP